MDTTILWERACRRRRGQFALWLAVIVTSVALVSASLACSAGEEATEAAMQNPTAASGEAAGGGSTSSGGAAVSIASIDPCALLTQADATGFFQGQANAGVKNVGSSSASCTYTSATQGDLLTLNVMVESGAAKDSSDYTSLRPADAAAVGGVGDDAYYNKSVFQLTVAKGQIMFTLNGAQKGTNAGQDALVPLANAVLPRLQQ